MNKHQTIQDLSDMVSCKTLKVLREHFGDDYPLASLAKIKFFKINKIGRKGIKRIADALRELGYDPIMDQHKPSNTTPALIQTLRSLRTITMDRFGPHHDFTQEVVSKIDEALSRCREQAKVNYLHYGSRPTKEN